MNQISLVPNRPDAEVAAELKEKIIAAYEPINTVLTEAKKAGFEVSVGIGPNPFGKFEITQLVIAKHF